MLTKKNDNYKTLELTDTLKEAGLEINIDGVSEDLEKFLKEDLKGKNNKKDKNK